MKPALAALALATSLCSVPSLADDTIKIAFIDPLSGGGAPVGEVGLKTFRYLADEINAAGGVNGKTIEIVGLDNKANPQESLIQAQKAADQGIRVITQGNSSAVAAALSDWVTKYNDRNPGKEVVYLNYAAVDPALTNAKCSYWHFRWDSNSDIKMAALTTFMKDRPNIKKVYFKTRTIRSDRRSDRGRAMLKEKRPDIEIVGDEVHPLLRSPTFRPTSPRSKRQAPTRWSPAIGSGLGAALKAAADADDEVDWYTYYAGVVGGPRRSSKPASRIGCSRSAWASRIRRPRLQRR